MAPNFLYRYRPINPNSLWEIRHNALYFQRLDGLNDPDEGRFDFDMTDLYFLREFLLKEALAQGELEYAAGVLSMPDDELRTHLSEQRRLELKQPQNWGVVCFTERPDNQHMWHKYAAEHCGVVLEYDFSQLKPSSRALRKVLYEERPALDLRTLLHEKNDGGFFDLLSYKSPDWIMEEEWRLLLPIDEYNPNDPKRLFQVPLTRVITGPRTSNKNKALVVHAVLENGFVRFEEI